MKVGAQPHPRLLISGFDQQTAEAISSLVPTARIAADLDAVEQIEFDALVQRGPMPQNVESHLHTLVFATDPVRSYFGMILTENGKAFVHYSGTSRASEFELVEGLTPKLAKLVKQTLVPLSRKQSEHGCLGAQISQSVRVVAVPSAISPWLWDSRKQILAGHFVREGGQADCWCVPSYIVDPVPWVEAALDTWSDKDLLRFPPRSKWWVRPAWQTPHERQLVTALESLDEERGRAMTDLDTRERVLGSDLTAERDRADGLERLLLTAQGATLVSVVSSALQGIGFAVQDMDAVWPAGDKREDLRVTDPEFPDWTAIVEVRGYANGAQTNDLLRIVGRFKRRFLKDEGVEASRSWYIANQFVAHDPDERAPLFGGKAPDIQTFADEDGLIIDTKTIFRIWMDLLDGRLDAGQVRELLRTSTGLLTGV